MSRGLLLDPRYRAAFMAAKPYALRIASQRVVDGKVLPANLEHEAELWRGSIAFAAVSRRQSVEQIAAVMIAKPKHVRRAA